MTTTTMWLSRYALSDGIREFTPSTSGSEGYVYEGWTIHKVGVDCHATKEAAIADAERRRVKKIASLRKQIAKLEALKFEVAP